MPPGNLKEIRLASKSILSAMEGGPTIYTKIQEASQTELAINSSPAWKNPRPNYPPST